MNFLEKDLEDIIYDADVSELNKRGLQVHGKPKRQLNLGGYGVLDLLYVQKRYFTHSYTAQRRPYPHIELLELKKDNIDGSTFFQSIGYARGVQRYLIQFYPELDFNIHIKLIGRKICPSNNFAFLPALFSSSSIEPNRNISSVSLYTYGYELNGILFKLLPDFICSEENFPVK